MTHFEIPLVSIKPESYVPFNVFRKARNNYALILEEGDIFPKNLPSLISSQHGNQQSVYVHEEDKRKYYSYLENFLRDITQDKKVSLKDKSTFLYDVSANTINSLFERPESREIVEHTKTLVTNIIDVILTHDDSVKNMMEIGSHDYYTYTHSVDVAVFSIGFANHLNYSYQNISDIGYAAMMHDIGKSRIPIDIINKKERLSEEEFKIMKNHPIYSYEILQNHGEINDDILKAVRNHHEKASGNGYPDKLIAPRTHEFAKVIAIVDIFSALTTRRSYKLALTSFNALQLIKNDMISDIDKNLFLEFIKFMAKISRQ